MHTQNLYEGVNRTSTGGGESGRMSSAYRITEQNNEISVRAILPVGAEDEYTVLSALVRAMAFGDREEKAAFSEATPHNFQGCFFHLPGGEALFTELVKRSMTGESADPNTLTDALDCEFARGLLDSAAFLDAGSTARPDHYAAALRRIQRDWRRRRAMRDAAEVIALAADSDDDGAVADLMKRKGEEAQRRSASEEPGAMLDDIVSARLAQFEEIAAGVERERRFTLNIRAIDEKLRGFAPGQMITAAARPGVGKTVLGLHCIKEAAEQGAGLFLINLEMSREQIADRIIASEYGRISYSDFNNPEILRRELGDLRDLPGERPVIVGNASVRSVPEVLRSLDRVDHMLRQRFDLPLQGIVIDYLQIMESGQELNRYRNRALEVAEMSRAIKMACLERGIWALCLSQLNRDFTGRPTLSNLRESGAIEQDSDVVMLLRRDEMDIGPEPEDFEKLHDWKARRSRLLDRMQIDIAKNRHGPGGEVEVRCLVSMNVMGDQKYGNAPG